MESGCNHHRSSSESSVYVGRLSGNLANGNGSTSSEPLDRISPLPTMSGDTSTSGKSESDSSPLADLGKNKQNKALALFATKFFDERIPIKKKLKWLKRVATIKNDGTVQFEVPGDIKPPKLDIRSGVDTLGANNEEPVLAEMPDLRPVHHGGARTTAAGLKAACQTTVIPFFGDQPFWGERLHERGVGPPPIPIDDFCRERLVEATHFMLKQEVKDRAEELAKDMKNEDGVTGAVKLSTGTLTAGIHILIPSQSLGENHTAHCPYEGVLVAPDDFTADLHDWCFSP